MEKAVFCLAIFFCISVHAHEDKCHPIFQPPSEAVALRQIAAIPIEPVRRSVSEMVRPLQKFLRASDQSTKQVMAKFQAMEASDHTTDTAEHSWSVATLAVKFGIFQGLPDEDVIDLFYASLIHDLGKIEVPDEILNKNARLTDDERNVMKKHANAQETIFATELAVFSPLRRYVDLARSHHERWDGQGYPLQIRSSSLSLPAQILIFADTFHAMISDRPYRKGKTVEQAITELLNEKDLGQFNPQLVEKLAEIIQKEV